MIPTQHTTPNQPLEDDELEDDEFEDDEFDDDSAAEIGGGVTGSTSGGSEASADSALNERDGVIGSDPDFATSASRPVRGRAA